MKRSRNSIAAAAGRTPSVVLAAFAPDTELALSLDGWILLESLRNGYVTGETPGLRDTVVCLLVMTDEDAVFEAKKRGKMDQLIAAATKDKKPGDILSMAEKIRAAFEHAMQPTDSGAEPLEKKSSPAAAGG